MRKYRHFFLLFILFFFIFFIFHNWFTLNNLSYGDWSYRFSESLGENPYIPYAWDPLFNQEFGNNNIFLLPLNTYFVNTARLVHTILGADWNIIERLFYFYPFLIISILSSYFLGRKLLNNSYYALLSSIIYTCNTYIILVVSGGQMGIGLAYAIAPLLIYSFRSTVDSIIENKGWKKNIQRSLISGILFSIILIFDLRISYILTAIIFFYCAFLTIFYIKLITLKRFIYLLFLVYILPFGVAFLIHSFWIVPYLIVGENPLTELGQIYTSIGAVRFFSFAFFENSLSLLHPNYPENIFGKVYFMRAEFLLIPVIAFSFLIFSKRYDKKILFFSFLAIAGIFLGKGANQPFGEFYIFLFSKIPFFQMFRDSTKWFIVIALSYSILIPFSLSVIAGRYKKLTYILSFGFVIFWIFTLRLVFTDVKGTLIPVTIPQDYIRLKNILVHDKKYARTLWLPRSSKFGYYSLTHPKVHFSDAFHVSSASSVFTFLNKEKSETLLEEAAIKYVIVPYDSLGEIFLKDRKYNPSEFQEFASSAARISYLTPVSGFSKLKVFEVKSPRDHFFLAGSKEKDRVNWKMVTPSEYLITVNNITTEDKLVFSESYNKNWKLIYNDKEYNSFRYDSYFNSFEMPKKGAYTVKVFYKPQEFVNKFLVISLVVFLVNIIIIIVFSVL